MRQRILLERTQCPNREVNGDGENKYENYNDGKDDYDDEESENEVKMMK